MEKFLNYFFGIGSEVEFSLLTMAHIVPIVAMLVIVFLIYRYKDQISNNERLDTRLRYIIAFTLIISEMSYYWRLVGMPILGPNPVEHLPIAVCGWVAIFGSYMIIGKSQTLFDIIYFWCLAGSTFAIATPTVITYTGPTRFRYYQFWVEHIGGFIAIFYMIFVHKMRPTIKSMIKSYGSLCVLAFIAYNANQIIGNGANYLFMARPESAPSILDVLPSNYVLRLLIMFVGITFLFGIVYVPWYLKDKKEKE